MTRELLVRVSQTIGHVEALLIRPSRVRWLLVLGHGAGAGMRHTFMETLAHELAEAGVATFRYQFPYMQQGRSRPDPPALLSATVRAAITAAIDIAPDLPLIAGGKSLGGRMTSQALSEPTSETVEINRRVRGIIFFGFPLHPPQQPGITRAEHLHRLKVPLLFLQGTRDALADLTLLNPLCAKLSPRATLHIFDGADHAFHVLKRSGTTDAEVLRRLARTTATWAESCRMSNPTGK